MRAFKSYIARQLAFTISSFLLVRLSTTPVVKFRGFVNENVLAKNMLLAVRFTGDEKRKVPLAVLTE